MNWKFWQTLVIPLATSLMCGSVEFTLALFNKEKKMSTRYLYIQKYMQWKFKEVSLSLMVIIEVPGWRSRKKLKNVMDLNGT